MPLVDPPPGRKGRLRVLHRPSRAWAALLLLALAAAVTAYRYQMLGLESRKVPTPGRPRPPPVMYAPAVGPRSTVLSFEPRVVVTDDFLSPHEVDELNRVLSRVHFGSTALVTVDGGAVVEANTVSSRIATIESTLRGGGDRMRRLLADLDRRVAELTLLPAGFQEPLRALSYVPGQYFRGHLDAHALKGRPTTSRVVTLLVYMDDVAEGDGGETYFPLAHPRKVEELELAGFREDPSQLNRECVALGGKDPARQPDRILGQYEDGSSMLRNSSQKPGPGMMVRSKKGRALWWYDRLPNGDIDLLSRHAGCPLTRGTKKTLTKWIHYKQVRKV